MSRNKRINIQYLEVVFKNPFDLIEEEEEPMSMPTNTHRPRN